MTYGRAPMLLQLIAWSSSNHSIRPTTPYSWYQHTYTLLSLTLLAHAQVIIHRLTTIKGAQRPDFPSSNDVYATQTDDAEESTPPKRMQLTEVEGIAPGLSDNESESDDDEEGEEQQEEEEEDEPTFDSDDDECNEEKRGVV